MQGMAVSTTFWRRLAGFLRARGFGSWDRLHLEREVMRWHQGEASLFDHVDWRDLEAMRLGLVAGWLVGGGQDDPFGYGPRTGRHSKALP